LGATAKGRSYKKVRYNGSGTSRRVQNAPGIWGDICGGRIFQLVDLGDVRDPKVSFQANYAWNDLCKIESIAVMNPVEMVKIIPGK
jgi:hypothetical protein